MNETGEMREGEQKDGPYIDAGGPNLGGVYRTGDIVDIQEKHLRFIVVNATGALLTLKFERFINEESVGSAA